MKDISLYDILGVLAPGTVLTVGVITLFPQTAAILTNEDFTVGDFGLIVLVSYVAGNLVAALGNFVEEAYWGLRGGTPTIRALGNCGGIRARDHTKLEAKMRDAGLLGAGENLASLPKQDRDSLARQLYTYVEARKRTRRIDLFNAQYGMNRGIAAGFVALIALLLFQKPAEWRIAVVLMVCLGLAAYRMNRFSNYYSGELIRQFLQAPEKVEPEKESPEDGD